MLFAEWRLISTGAADCYVNMAIDEATLLLVAEHRVPPTVRLYFWDVPCHTIGYLQRLGKGARARFQHSGKCVRRLTGGRACLHGGDVCYSVTVSLADTVIPSNVLASFERISSGVIEGLRLLGVDARYVPPAEILVNDQVIATAAQARRQGVLLHQGTVALAPTQLEARGSVSARRLTPLSGLVGAEIETEEAVQALGMGLKRALGVDLSPSMLFAKEKRLARQLLREKYARPEWTFSR
jgi:lipoyl(octanoyl) transferase